MPEISINRSGGGVEYVQYEGTLSQKDFEEVLAVIQEADWEIPSCICFEEVAEKPHVFQEAPPYAYSCVVHPRMDGKRVVQDQTVEQEIWYFWDKESTRLYGPYVQRAGPHSPETLARLHMEKFDKEH